MENEKVELTGYFKDGVRRIDLVLVIEDGMFKEKIDKVKLDYLINVIKIGLQIEVGVPVMKRHKKLLFIKIHAPDTIIEEYGSYFNIRKYFKKIHNEFINPNRNLLGLKFEKEFIRIVRLHYPGPVNYSNVERSTIVYHILLSLPFGKHENYVGLRRLIDRNIILDAFALHDGPYFFVQNQIEKNLAINGRQILFYFWVGKKYIFKKQPLHLIREYFGEKVAFYFACYEYFNIALIFASMLGIFTTIEGYNDTHDDGGINEACNNSNAESKKTICPLCQDFNTCPFRNLTDFCLKVTITNFIDHPWTMIYCILISLWAISFILLWRLKRSYLSWLWEYDQTDTNQAIRSEFETNVKNIRRSKLTGIVIDTDSIKMRVFRLSLTVLSLFIWVLVVMVITIWIAVCKYKLSAEFNKISKMWRDYLAVIAITCFYILGMNILQKLALFASYQLTRMENHKTNDSFKTYFIVKLFSFGFICNFSLLISFYFLNVLYTYPSDKNRWYMIGGIGMMNCGPESCLDELCVALIVTILVQEYVMKLPACFLKMQSDYSQARANVPCWEREYLLKPLTETVLIDKFTHLIMKFTLVGLFGFAFPLSPLLLLISGIFNIRYEARQFVVGSRRPLISQSPSQQVWYKIMIIVIYAVPCFNTIAMTWMTRMLHYTHTDNQTSYFTFSMGRFVTEDYKKVTGPGSPAEALSNYRGFVPSECFFPGLMFRSKKLDGEYYPVERFWRIRYDKHILMLEVEHVALLLILFLHYVIPSSWRDIADTMAIEDRIKRRPRIVRRK